MSVAKHPNPVYDLVCDTCDYVANEDGDGILRFDSIEGARRWASDEGWDDNNRWPNPQMTCPACVATAEDKALEAAS